MQNAAAVIWALGFLLTFKSFLMCEEQEFIVYHIAVLITSHLFFSVLIDTLNYVNFSKKIFTKGPAVIFS